MSNNVSVWEQTFRQPDDINFTNELGRLSAQVATTNAKNLQLEADKASLSPRGTFFSSVTQELAGATWNVITTTGSVGGNRGGVVLGAGSQGLVLPTTGLWLVTVQGYLTTPPGSGIRVIGGLSTNGAAPSVIANTLANVAPGSAFRHDTHISYTMLTNLNAGQLRASLYLEASVGPVFVTISGITVVQQM